MREIKFRGRTPQGRLVFGDLAHQNDSIYIDRFKVIPSSLAQFGGVDSEGNEIYEGDTVIAHDKEYTVQLVPKYGLFYDLKHCKKK